VALGRDLKGKISPVLYLCGIVLAFVNPWLAMLVFASLASMWPVPDRRTVSPGPGVEFRRRSQGEGIELLGSLDRTCEVVDRHGG
jgi:hypothetical protein